MFTLSGEEKARRKKLLQCCGAEKACGRTAGPLSSM
jgi:hypothetical protein